MTSSDLRASLDELEKSLRSFGAPVTAAFRPGARPEQVRALLAAECLTPSDDLLTWWSWHDGAEVGAPPVESGPGLHYRAENTLFGPWPSSLALSSASIVSTNACRSSSGNHFAFSGLSVR